MPIRASTKSRIVKTQEEKFSAFESALRAGRPNSQIEDIAEPPGESQSNPII
jgi:hypothetical protein